jgi:hypothetical protein
MLALFEPPPALAAPDAIELTAQLRTLTREALRYRESKQFVASTWDTLPYRLLRITNEIEELEDAIEASRAGGSRGHVRDELADCLLFTLTVLEDVFPGQLTVRTRYHGGRRADSHAALLVKPLRNHVRQAGEAWARGDARDVQVALELLVAAAFDLHGRLFRAWSLVEDAHHKLDVMNSRPLRHGKDPRC